MPVKLGEYDLSRHVIILTGATDGIGKEMARILSGFSPKRLILTIRNKEKGNNLLEYIKSSNGKTDNIELWEMDLADLQSVKDFASKFINEVGELHILINNAGVMANRVIKTKDNLELQFQVNHLAPFLLTKMLLDTIEKSVSAELPGRISFVSSTVHSSGEIDFDNLNLEKGTYWNPLQAYSNTKLMNVIVSNELGRRIQNEISMHPGSIKTNLGHLNTGAVAHSLLIFVVGIFGTTHEQGAVNVLYPTLSENKETGKYYDKGVEAEPIKLANDQEIVKKFWNVSEQILRDHGMID